MEGEDQHGADDNCVRTPVRGLALEVTQAPLPRKRQKPDPVASDVASTGAGEISGASTPIQVEIDDAARTATYFRERNQALTDQILELRVQVLELRGRLGKLDPR